MSQNKQELSRLIKDISNTKKVSRERRPPSRLSAVNSIQR